MPKPGKGRRAHQELTVHVGTVARRSSRTSRIPCGWWQTIRTEGQCCRAGTSGGEQAPLAKIKRKNLTWRTKGEILHRASRWAMSPVLSSTARTFGIRRRRVPQSTATLFPVSPYKTSPKPRAGDARGGVHSVLDEVDCATVAGLGGSTSGYTTADCPPPTSQEAVPHGFEARRITDPGSCRTAGGHCPPRSTISRGRARGSLRRSRSISFSR